jgi:hypothetical protein
MMTNKVLLSSDTKVLSAWPAPNVCYLLIPEHVAEIRGDREFAPAAPSPADYTAIFTRVGKIEVATEVGGVTQHLIDPTTGLADVPASVAADLHIPAYQDAPFGGYLYIFGAFSRTLYDDPSVYYRIHYKNLDDASDTGYLGAPLKKTKYTVDFATGKVAAERVTRGPERIGSDDNCYRLTPIASSDDVFWSFPDLVAVWPTGGLNGRYRIRLEVGGLTDPAEFGSLPDLTNITLRLDNVPPVASILPLDVTDFDTPRVYIPGDPPPGDDLIDNPLGVFPADYGGTDDPTCLILNMEGPTGSKYLAFKLTAYHASGFLRYWHFRYERNDKHNDTKIAETLIGKKYDGAGSTDDLGGARISSSVTGTDGFQNKFLYLDTDHLEPLPPPDLGLGGCAYRFVIRAAKRTTNGYRYIGYAGDQDLHYVQR